MVNLRLLAAIVVAVLFGLAQLQPGSRGVTGVFESIGWPPQRLGPSIAAAQDGDNDDEEEDNDGEGGDEDNDDADADNDDEDADNDDEDADNDDEDADNDEEDADNADDEDAENDEEDADNADDEDADNEDADDDDLFEDADNTSGGPTDALPPPPPPVDPVLPSTDAVGTSNGGDVTISLGGERLVVRMFPWMPAGVTVTVRKVAPERFPAPAGTVTGDLFFTIEARDATGAVLTTMPGEVNVSIRYNDQDVAGLNEPNLTLSRLNPATNQWQPAPKLYRDAATNYIAASVMDTGAYVVHAP